MDYLIIGVPAALAGAVLMLMIRRSLDRTNLAAASNKAQEIEASAKKEAAQHLKEAEVEAKENRLKIREEFEGEARETREELRTTERRLET